MTLLFLLEAEVGQCSTFTLTDFENGSDQSEDQLRMIIADLMFGRICSENSEKKNILTSLLKTIERLNY